MHQTIGEEHSIVITTPPLGKNPKIKQSFFRDQTSSFSELFRRIASRRKRNYITVLSRKGLKWDRSKISILYFWGHTSSGEKKENKEWAQSCGYHISNKFDTFIVFHAKLKKNKDKLQHCIIELVFKNPMRFIPIFHDCNFRPCCASSTVTIKLSMKTWYKFHDCIRPQLLARKDARRLKY